MIGQTRFQENIKRLSENGTFPRFSIIVGKTGSGRKTSAKEISKVLGIQYVLWNNKIEDIRELKQIMENQSEEILYCIPNYEDMSLGARNSVLKMCEEPPRNAYIVLTSYSQDIIIPTILSRGTLFELDGYSCEELKQIALDCFGIDKDKLEDALQISEVPGELELTNNVNLGEFKEFVSILWNNIGKASSGNLLKVTSKLKLKDDSSGYDLVLFINALMNANRSLKTSRKKLDIYNEIILAKRNIQLKYNKLYIIDNLLLNIRSILNGTV